MEMSSSSVNSCQYCIHNYLQWKAAHAEIAVLKEENRKLQLLIREQVDSTEEKSAPPITNITKCSLCEVGLTAAELERHLCINQESVVCPFCPSTAFQTTLSLLDHVTQHNKSLRRASKSKRSFFKCDQCTSAFTMEILLECHKMSHVMDTNQTPEPIQIKIDPTELTIYQKPIKEEVSFDQFTMNKIIHPQLEQSASVGAPADPLQGNEKLFKCGFCDTPFELPSELSKHMNEAHREKKVVDSKLPRSQIQNNLPNGISVQSRKQKEKKTFECFLCRASVIKFQKLKVHIRHHHKRNRNCTICKMELTANELNSHLCGDEKSIRCEYCSDTFTTTTALMKHLDNSNEKKMIYKCEKCTRNFLSIFLKDHHTKLHDSPEQSVCEICSKAFFSEAKLKTHMRIHAAESHLCEECGKSFASFSGFQQHQKVHGQKPQFQCPDCPRAFLYREKLKRHSEVHRENKYVCTICLKELGSRSTFRKHQRIHERTEADRIFACKLCPQKFFNSSNLEKHQLVHTSMRLFKCPHCPQTYKYNGDLSKHLRTHLGDEIHECKKCLKRFKYPIELRKHEFEHYKEEKEASEMTK